MSFCRFAQSFLHFLRGILLALGFVTLQLLAFVTCFLGSAFGAMALAAGIHFFWNFELPPFAICLLQGLLLIRCTEIYAFFYEDFIVGAQIIRGIRRYPIFLGLVPVLASMSLNLYGIYVIYARFTQFHLYADQNPTVFLEKILTEGTERILLQKTLVVLSVNVDVCHFIIAFSYLIFTTAMVIQAELKEQLKSLSVTSKVNQEFAAVTKAFFLVTQIGLTIGYAIPLFYSYIVLNYMSRNVMDKGTSFFYLCIIAASIGFLGSFIESKSPFPQVKGRGPLFTFERNVQARILLLKYGLLPFVYFSFFDHRSAITPAETGSAAVPSSESSVQSIDPHFLLFAIFFALLILHTLKILSMSLFIHRIMEHRRIRRQELQEHQREAAEALELEIAEEGEGNGGVHVGVGPAGNGIDLDPTFDEVRIGNGDENPGDTGNNNPGLNGDDEKLEDAAGTPPDSENQSPSKLDLGHVVETVVVDSKLLFLIPNPE